MMAIFLPTSLEKVVEYREFQISFFHEKPGSLRIIRTFQERGVNDSGAFSQGSGLDLQSPSVTSLRSRLILGVGGLILTVGEL